MDDDWNTVCAYIYSVNRDVDNKMSLALPLWLFNQFGMLKALELWRKLRNKLDRKLAEVLFNRMFHLSHWLRQNSL